MVDGYPAFSAERVRHVLVGGSVVDWPRLNLATVGDVNEFLRVNEFDPEDPSDVARIRTLRDRAADYLRVEHRYRLPPELITGDPRDLFLFAAGVKGRRHARSYACIMLKAIHVIHHLEARELGLHLPLSQADMGHLLEAKVRGCVKALRDAGLKVVDLSGGQKARTSLITKLLAKKETLAAQVHDRVRFRLVVESPEELPLVVDALATRLFPFNYVVPGQSQNDLVNVDALPGLPAPNAAHDGRGGTHRPINEFSGATFRVINFVVDIPLRVPDAVLRQRNIQEDLGRVIFQLAEMQLVDAATARRNEHGDNNHEEYKNRQRARVRARLEQGADGRMREPTGD